MFKKIIFFSVLLSVAAIASNTGPGPAKLTTLPDQSGHATEVLTTSGSTLYWAPGGAGGSGNGSVTSVTGTAPISVTASTLTPNVSISQSSSSTDGYLSAANWSTFNSKLSSVPFPLNAPAGTLTAPSINFQDNDSGMWSNGDGNTSFSANGFLRMEVNQNQVDVIGPLDVTGNISAANFPPTGNANAFAGYDSLGALFTIPGWSFQDGSGALSAYISRDVTLDGGFTSYNFETAAEATADNLIGINGINVDMHFDRNNTGADLQTIYGINSSARAEGSGFVNYVLGANIGAQGGNGNGGGVGSIQGAYFNSTLASGTTMSSNGSLNGIFVGINSTSGTADNGYLFNGNVDSTNFTNNFNGIISSANNSTFNNTYAMFNGYTNNSNTFNGNNWYGMVLGNDAPISGFADGVRFQTNGNVIKNLNGFSISTNANTLTSPGYNMTAFDANINNTTFNGDNFNAFNGFIAGVGATQTNVNAFAFNNQLSGTNRFTGLSIFNNQDQIEEIRGVNFNSTGDARTMTGIDVVMTGNATDDGQGLRVNVSSLTSSTQHIKSGSFEGGQFQVNGGFTPFSSTPVEIGNNFITTSSIVSGSPLTGTDQFITFIQSNLDAQDDITTGPYGLDTNMVGAVSQIVVGSGKTLPLTRSLLLGTSIPAGSGGTITEHVAMTVLGLPSFGGSVTNPTRTGIEDGTILGQGFCDGATTCHFLNVRDGNAQNSFAGGIQLTTSGSQPTCDAQHRGTFWNIEGGAGVADILQICQKDAADAYVWVTK